jgi:hypothetical protein
MKFLAVIPLIFCAALAMAQAGIKDTTGGYGPTSEYNKSYDAGVTFTFNGKVTSKIVEPPVKGMANGVELVVKQSDGTKFNVQLGPEWFVSRMPLKVDVGDNVIIQGSRGKLDGKKVVFAQTITKGKQVIAFRSKTGWGRWNAQEPNVALPENPNYTGTIAGIDSVNYGGVFYDVYHIDTGAGNVTVLGAPSWYGQRQQRYLQLGNSVAVVGAFRPVSIGNNVFVADGFYTDNSFIVANPWWR